MIYRQFGIPARIAIVRSVEEIMKMVEHYNSKNNCYITVYSFDYLHPDGKPFYDSALVNTLWYDIDSPKNLSHSLSNVKQYIKKHCEPEGIVPRIYFTGGKGFQLNEDMDTVVHIPNSIKRIAIIKHYYYIKNIYNLKYLDDRAAKNTVSALRRLPNTKYISNKKKLQGRWCIPLTVDEVMSLSTKEIINLSKEGPRDLIKSSPSPIVRDMFLNFLCKKFDIKTTKLDDMEGKERKIRKNINIFTPKENVNFGGERVRPCVDKFIKKAITPNYKTSHDENNIIAFELLNSGMTNDEIAMIFSLVFENFNMAMTIKQLDGLRKKKIMRYSHYNLKDLGVCNDPNCPG